MKDTDKIQFPDPKPATTIVTKWDVLGSIAGCAVLGVLFWFDVIPKDFASEYIGENNAWAGLFAPLLWPLLKDAKGKLKPKK